MDINVNVPDLNGSYDEGYAEGERIGYGQGKTDGVNEQKSKLESINITENGTYSKEDGYNHIEVNVPDLNGSYDEGKTDGVNEQKGKLTQIRITENGTYAKEDGYSEVVVDVPDLNGSYDEGYAQGKTDGVSEQKSKLETISITENGTYTKEDGYNHIEVNVPDLNGSYDEGYAQGKTDGVSEQKSKLETINITENGTYTKEDGYNHIEVNVTDLNGSYDEGYGQGQADAAANTRVLNVTENGNYLSKFSDPIIPTTYTVTGVYADGTEFYSYAELNGKVFNTNIPATKDSRIEFWYKNDATVKTYATVIGGQTDEGGYIFKFCEYSRDTYRIEYGNHRYGKLFNYNFYYDTSKWNHIIFSKQDGLYVNDKLICNVQGEEWAENETIPNFWINAAYLGAVNDNANGHFGMIKINDTIIIPTADGFKNANTGELLEVLKDGSYTYTENLPIYGEGELYKTINVDVIPKINVQKTGLRLGYSKFTEVPEWVDFESITDMSNMFSNCSNLQTIPQIDTSGVTSMESMFYNCGNLQTIPQIDTSKVSNATAMFYYCRSLKTLPNNFNFGNCNRLYNCFTNASITDYSFLETWIINPNADMDAMIDNTNTTYVPAIPCVGRPSYQQSAIFWTTGDFSKLTYFGGWIGRKYNVNKDRIINKMPNLT